MRRSWLGLEGSFILLLVSTALAHEGSQGSGGITGFCSHPGLCHSIVDSFGHGLLGTGWTGFLIVFTIWLVGLVSLLRYLMRNLELEVKDYDLKKDEKGFTLFPK